MQTQVPVMAAAPTLLGFAGELVDTSEPEAHYSTKVGGQPVFIGERPPLNEEVTCRKCGSALALLFQVSRLPGYALKTCYACLKRV